jgi:L-threonylcarbamoyladenylate synthase
MAAASLPAVAPPPSPIRLRAAVQALAAGGIIAYPTEAVWGLGCEPANAHAVQHLLALKSRSPAQGLILIAADLEQVSPFLGEVEPALAAAAIASWPGPHTWLWPASARCPPWITGGRNTVAVRITAHPVARALCRAYGGPIVSTSANRSGHAPARSVATVRLTFGTAIDAVVPGALGGSPRPTPIRDLATGALLRA